MKITVTIEDDKAGEEFLSWLERRGYDAKVVKERKKKDEEVASE